MVEVAKTAGFCFGVRRAVETAERACAENGGIWALGDIIHNTYEVERLRKLGVQKADTLEELCDQYGIDKATFMETVNAYNEAKASGADDPDFGVPNAYMVSMTEGPFYATYYQPMPTNCLAGLECDEFCRILDQNGQPIPNLYGVGELVIGSVVGDGNYPCCGTCLASGIYGGPIAVRHALGIMK